MSISPLIGIAAASTPVAAANAAGTGSTTGTGSSTGSSSASSTSNISSQLANPQMFLQLLVAELQNQDPTNPTDPSTILQQTSELAQMESVTTQTSAITGAQSTAQDSEATGLVGRTVSALVAGNTITGPVSDVQLSSSGTPTLTINGTSVPLSDVRQVSS
ncbi:MAG: flagellar hook capping protein [Acidimicrobiaceae bacterium]|jgi:flagellar basal-body rod modification protein FlgD|nr:flagellar hook capping protein [Acidimicrobiaceae bacterium]